MSSACYNCASRFGTFNKELGCKNCGFAFCKKCLSKKAAVPKLDNKTVPVCDKCYNILNRKTSGQTASSAASFEPPDALLKRLAALEQSKVQPPSPNVQLPANKTSQKQRGLSKEDAEIAERLSKLKENQSKPQAPSQSEIEQRLAKLKQDEKPAVVVTDQDLSDRLAGIRGQDPSVHSKPITFVPDRRTQQEQIDSLLEEICDEVQMEDRFAASTVTDIQDRLNRLKSDTAPGEVSVKNDLDQSKDRDVPPQLKSDSLNIPLNSAAKSDDQNWDEVERAMRDAAAEAQLEADKAIEGMKKDKELWNRVQQLKDARHNRQRSDEHNNGADSASLSSNDSDTAAGRVVQQILDENELDEKCDTRGMDVERTSLSESNRLSVSNKACSSTDRRTAEPNDELPWCCICNNDATLRCNGCDGDLYCQRCYREGHSRFDMKDHRTLPFTSKPSGSGCR